MNPLIAALLLVPALAGAEQPRDFAYGIPLRTSGQDALQQLEVPRAVYEGVVRADLGDLRVFNAAGEVVPHAFRPRVTTTKETLPPVAVTLFPIRTDAPAGLEGVELHLERRGDRTVVDLRTREGRPARGTKLVGYLADARALDKPIRAITLELPAGVDQIVARVTIEASDDLRQWATLASGAPVVALTVASATRLEEIPWRPFAADEGSLLANLGLGLAIMMWNYSGWDTPTTVLGETHAPVGQRQYVPVIAAHLGRGALVAADVERPRRHRLRRQQRLLDLARQLDFVGQPLALEHFGLGALQRLRHVVHRHGQQAQLGAVAQPNRRIEIAATDALEALAQRADRPQQLRHQHERGGGADQRQQREQQ